MRTFFVLVSLLITAPPQAQPTPLAGTYAIAVCKAEPCRLEDTTTAQVHGYLVLAEEQLTAAKFPAELARAFFRSPMARPANACYATTINTAVPRQTYAGIGDFSLTTWTPTVFTRRGIRFALHRSPDAGHVVEATISDAGELRGTGLSSGMLASAPPPDWGADVVVGKRIGPVDLTPCADGARRYLARISRDRVR